MKIALIAPIGNSLYSLLAADLLSREKDVEVCAILVRSPWSVSRFLSEWRRDGARLARKIVNKWLKRDQPVLGSGESGLLSLAKEFKVKDRDLFSWSRNKGISLQSVSDLNSSQTEIFLKKAEPDLIIFTGGGLIRKNILAIPKLGVLNCHSGWLPRYRGMDVVEWALLESKGRHPRLGLSVHFMDQGVDTGPILLQKKIALEKKDTVVGIRARMLPMMVATMVSAVKGLRDDRLKPKLQNRRDGHQYFVMHSRLRAEIDKHYF